MDAAASVLGGSEFVYAMRGDGRAPVSPVSADAQRAALVALIGTLAPAELAIPTDLLALIPPRPAGYPRHRELFPRYTGPVFDALSPAIVAANLTVGQMLDSTRAARIVTQHAVDAEQLGLAEMLDTLLDAVFDARAATTYEAEVARSVERVVVDRVINLADAAPLAQVRAEATAALRSSASARRCPRRDHPRCTRTANSSSVTSSASWRDPDRMNRWAHSRRRQPRRGARLEIPRWTGCERPNQCVGGSCFPDSKRRRHHGIL